MPVEEKELLKKSVREIEQLLQWGDSLDWTNQDFEELSEKVFEKTQIKLSITTLKRLWGKVKYDQSFNGATLNAIAQFLGHESWKSYKLSIKNLDAGHVVKEESIVREFNLKPFFYRVIFKSFATFAGLLFLVAIVYFTSKAVKAREMEKLRRNVTFKSRLTSDNLPNSVIFNYDIGEHGVDSVMIQQSWDPKRREKVSAKKREHSSIYYYPGNFNARLIVNEEEVSKTRVLIATKGWRGIVVEDPVPIYLSTKEIQLKDGLGIEKSILKEKLNKTVFNNRFVNFYNIRSFENLMSNHFNFEAEVHNTSPVEESLCRRVNIFILYNGGAVIIPLADKGCVSELELFTGVEFFHGKDKDLSKFGCDFSKPQKISCEVKDNKLDIQLNSQSIYSSTAEYPKQEMVGFCISFEGTGLIKRVKLGEPDKTPVLEENFERN